MSSERDRLTLWNDDGLQHPDTLRAIKRLCPLNEVLGDLARAEKVYTPFE